MKRYIGRILICVLPVLVSIIIVGWAYAKYTKGEGGFRMGVDLSGGTILVYEVDQSKMTEQARQSFKPEDLAASLKRRIDPADLFNVTIRPVSGGDTPRVEIILPTGGRQQTKARETEWHTVLEQVKAKYKADWAGEGSDVTLDDVPQGQFKELIDRLINAHLKKDGKDVDPADVSKFIYGLEKQSVEKRAFTGEEVENIKNLIQQAGRLEFRILANRNDDKDAIAAAEEYMKDPKNAERLKDLNVKGDPPPPPTQNGDRYFTATLHNESARREYSWVEMGKEELYSMQLNASAENTADPDPGRESFRQAIWKEVKATRDHATFSPPPQRNIYPPILYCRTIPNPERISPRDREQGKKVEFFVLTRESEPGTEVTGDFLTSASESMSEGKRAVSFTFNSEGASRFQELTTANQPTGADKNTAFKRQLAVVLDGQVRSAPTLNDIITSQGQISGDFTPKAIEDLVRILRAGALPATLKSQPVSENTMGATLGEDTIFKGALSIGIAFAAVLIFMLIYYRFAGIVACFALLANLLLTIAFMVLVSATFTLPGLAGLVLMLGMAVDANVLIYERLREERERGASLPLAIRNGYDRAFPTIIDTHLTSIFTAIVLYVVGNDQLKGFGISLTVGLIISLFTSLYVTRTIFDIFLGNNWLHSLYFMQLFKRPNINFMRIRYYFFAGTVIATVLGAALFIYRLDKGGLNIDFVGGTAYSGLLTEPVDIQTLRTKLEKPLAPDDLKQLNIASDLPEVSVEQVFVNNPDLSQGDKSSLFTIRTSDKDAPKVQRIINYKLGDLLKRIEMKDPDIVAVNGKTSEATLEFVKSTEADKPDYASPAQVTMLLNTEFKDLGIRKFTVARAKGSLEEEGRFSKMRLDLTEPVPVDALKGALAKVQTEFHSTPQPERLENFDRQLAADTQQKALYAIVASWAIILLYLWFRFGSWTFGAATVLCLIHDLFFTLGAIAVCHWLHWIPVLGEPVSIFGFPFSFGLADFKIDLPSVAALLTLVGYSVSDTIVVFDRIREVRGKNPLLTATMINDSVNQTLSRTILSSLTVFLVVGVLYMFGGEGVHLFAFVMVVGVVVGTYSSIYIASPLLLMFGEGTPATQRARNVAAARAADAATAQA
jgi:SecD/SecF fusion protein